MPGTNWCRVAVVAQHFGDGAIAGVHDGLPLVGVGDAGAVVVATGHEAGTGGGTEGGDAEVGELDGLLGEAVKLRGAEVGIAMGTVNLGDRWLALRFTPQELRLIAQGWSLRPTLGLKSAMATNPEGVVPCARHGVTSSRMAQPRWG